MLEGWDQNVGQLERVVDERTRKFLFCKLDLLPTNAGFRSSVREIDTIETPMLEM